MIFSRNSLLALAGLALALGSARALADPNFAQVVPPPATKAAPDETAPAVFRVDFETSRGPVLVEFTRERAPHGVDRLFTLVKAKYFDGARFYRVVPGFVVQWGSAADPAVSKAWDRPIPDDPVQGTNARGTITFAALGEPNSRTTQLFINLADNPGLDGMGFAPLGRVVDGMRFIDQIYSGDGENPDQGVLMEQGNAYLQKAFPHLDYIATARLVP
jgi:peptidyl-prolyl cis-trans isomerase A (cyclophilin A)